MSGARRHPGALETVAVLLAAIALFVLFFGAFLIAPMAILLIAGAVLVLGERSRRRSSPAPRRTADGASDAVPAALPSTSFEPPVAHEVHAHDLRPR